MITLARQAEDHSSLEAKYVYDWFHGSRIDEPRSLHTTEGWVVAVNDEHRTRSSHYEYPRNLQTQAYNLPKASDRDLLEGDASNLYFHLPTYAPQRKLDDAKRQIEKTRQEAMEALALSNEIDPIPDSAYDDANSLLYLLSRYNVPMPDIGWAEDGSLGFEWRPENGIVTMGVYGDNLVIFGAFFDEKRKVEGICTLSDTALLRGIIVTLSSLLV